MIEITSTSLLKILEPIFTRRKSIEILNFSLDYYPTNETCYITFSIPNNVDFFNTEEVKMLDDLGLRITMVHYNPETLVCNIRLEKIYNGNNKN